MARALGLRVLQAEWVDGGGIADPAKLTLYGHGPALAHALREAGAEPEAVGLRSLTLVMGPRLGLDTAGWRRLLERLARVPAPTGGLIPPPPASPAVLPPAAVDRKPWRAVPLCAAAGLVAARPLTPYPPGIPSVMPGELITADWIAWVNGLAAEGLRVEGLDASETGEGCREVRVWVVA
jgi:lysine decarboxylase